MRTYKSESKTKPQEWDKTSSEVYVYHHTNIVAVPATEEREACYSYDVTEYTNREYIGIMDGIVAEHDDAIVELAELIGG